MKIKIAIDPGAQGGIAWNDHADRAAAIPMPDTEAEVVQALKEIIDTAKTEGDQVEAHLEQVCGYAGGAGAPGSAMFNFGMGYGVIQGALLMAGVPIVRWSPQKWQKAVGVGNKDKADTPSGKAKAKSAWKNKLKAEAGRRNPSIKVTLLTADALLIHAAATAANAKDE